MGNYITGYQWVQTSQEKERLKIDAARNRYIEERFANEDDVIAETSQTTGSPKDEVDGGLTNGKGVLGQRRKLQKIPSVLTDLEVKAMNINITDHRFPFENLIFEGGGNKGLAYCGAIRVLEEQGLYDQIKRYAGSSAGAMTAALLAVGYDSFEIQDFLSQDLSHFFLDARFGVLSLVPNLLTGYGWNPGRRIYQWFGEALAKKTNNPDISFNELYEKTGKELCVVVTNLNHMTEEYCHPKTTPDMPIRLAVRMSMSIPGMFQATNYTVNGETNTYVDGGVICNYPIHCYDGWWLSMKQGDTFLERLQPLDALPQLLDRRKRFRRYPDEENKTLGFLLYADSEQDVFRFMLEKRIGTHLGSVPDTKLAKAKLEQKKIQEKAKREHRRVTLAVDQFLKVLKKHNLDKDDHINREELENAFDDDEFSQEACDRLFGKDCTAQKAFELLDKDGNGKIHFNELMNFIQGTGISLQQRFLGYQRRDINGLFSFFDTLQNALLTNVKRAFVNEDDMDRTVGINTGYVGTSDFKLEKEDMAFVVDQGYRSTKSFLKYYAAKEEIERELERANKDISTKRSLSFKESIDEAGEEDLVDAILKSEKMKSETEAVFYDDVDLASGDNNNKEKVPCKYI
ncbi:hypothetical protein FSP39_024196 [Pinctada imbricata]|uniref:Uncharacterized protein n=1 Tax=Pinctada imbricata TaxID=66713 RepID=A0AA88YNW1_PINIB|nr:hypothetical protein FSP39_024196 [Pinctada imbricata]